MPAKAAEWWSNPDAKDDKPVVAHTPDGTKYWTPDERQQQLLGGRGTVIPQANPDGLSKGFDGRFAGVVHVDPDAPDGGTIVDLGHLSGSQLNAAFANATYPHEVYYNLGTTAVQSEQPQQVQAVQPSRSNARVPDGTYIVPPSDHTGLQHVQDFQPMANRQQLSPLPPMGVGVPQATQQMAAPPPQYAQPPQPPQYAQPPQQPQYAQPPQQFQPPQPAWSQAYGPTAYQPPAPNPDFSQLMTVLGQMGNAIASLGQRMDQAEQQPAQAQPQHYPPMRQPAPLQTLPNERPSRGGMQPARPDRPRRRAPLPAPPPLDEADFEDGPQTMQQIRDAEDDTQHREGLVVGFETLNMSFITGPLPVKPKKEVFFGMGQMGTMACRYHAVSESDDCLALVYDTRYEDGQQFLPPDTGDVPVEVSVPSLKAKYLCSSLGLHFSIGVLDIVVLVKRPKQIDQEEDEG